MAEEGSLDTCVKTPRFRSPLGGGSDSDVSPSKEGAEATTPTRKNKRKMTEPKKRADFSIKRFCPESPGSLSDPEDRDPEGGALGAYPRGVQITSPASCLTERPQGPLTATVSRESPAHPESRLLYSHLTVPIYPHRAPVGPVLGMAIPSRPDSVASTSSSLGEPMSAGYGGPGSVSNALDDSCDSPSKSMSPRKARKNYKNMTRERRVDANARERSRVHTISAAFESLRRAVPSYSYNQRLSKLAILRIACSYILSLARLADLDYSEEKDDRSFADCVDECTKVIQSEGRTKRRH